MKKWQRFWLISIILFFSYHLVRDIFQDFGVKNILSSILVKSNPSSFAKVYWMFFNTYIIEIAEIFLGIISLKKNKFGREGYLTIFIALFFSIIWLFYWMFL